MNILRDAAHEGTHAADFGNGILKDRDPGLWNAHSNKKGLTQLEVLRSELRAYQAERFVNGVKQFPHDGLVDLIVRADRARRPI